MTADRNNSAVVAAPADDDGHEIRDSVARRRDARRRSNQRPRCSRCGQFDSGPGGAGFGDGKTFCEACAVRLDFERGDGRTQ
jgi:hypothetical protein